MKKLTALFLSFFSIYTAIACSFQLNSYFNAVTSTDPNIFVAETKFASMLILMMHLLQMLSFFGLFYYAFSIVINNKLNYTSKNWLNFGVFATVLYFIELIVWSLPLRSVEGYESSSTFISSFFEVLLSSQILYHNVFQLLAYASFFGLFSLFKK